MQTSKEGSYVFCFFGRSGSGKGVQSKMMIEHLKSSFPDKEVLYIETGQLLRDFTDSSESHSAGLAKKVMEEGGLLPSFLPIWLWADLLVKRYTGKENLVFDGIARRLNEAPVLEVALGFYGCNKPNIIYVDTPPEIVMERLKRRGRYDDTEEKIKERLEWYEENVIPAINFFRNSENVNFLAVDGDQSPEDIHQEIVEKTLGVENDKT